MRISDWSSDVCSSDLIERAKDYADRQISRDEQLLVRREQEADRQASELILGKADGFTDPSQIPRAVWGNMSVAARQAATNAAKPNASGVNIQTNRSEERRVGKECGSTCRSRLRRSI